MDFETRARGKLLLTGEYFVLDGATALAMPVRFGQTLRVEPGNEPGYLNWCSLESDGSIWFEAKFELPDLRIKLGSDLKTSLTLFKILNAFKSQKPEYFAPYQSYQVQTQNDFPRAWGLGTSSTLIAALARWMEANPYEVLFETLGGSGYDLACAYAKGPILYHLDAQNPVIEPISFAPAFSNHLYFVFLGKKQNSREGIARYRQQAPAKLGLIEKISSLTHQLLRAKTLAAFEAALREHEMLVSETMMIPRAKDLYFNDFWGEIKSLGAWGGDFVLASSERSETETRAYFSEKGFEVVLGWGEMC